MVLTRSYAALLVSVGVAHYGRTVHQRARRWLEVIRGERIDYVLGIEQRLAPKDPPVWHPKGLPDRLAPRFGDGRVGPAKPGDRRLGPRSKLEPKRDVLTELGEGHERWKRPRPEADVKAKARELKRRCPNCNALTNAREHCVGVSTVLLKRPAAKPRTVLKRVYQPYRPRTLRRVCQCGEFTNDAIHCKGKRTFAG